MRYARAVLISVVEEASGAAGRGAGSFLGGFLNNPAVVILGALGIVFLFFGGDIRKAFGSLGESISKIGSVELPDINFPEFPSLPDINLSLGGTTDAITDTISNLQNQISKILAGGNFQQITNPDDLFEGAISPDDPLATIPRTDCECGLSIVQDASGNITQKCVECEEQTAFRPPADPPVTVSDEIELSFQPAPIDTSIQIAPSIETDSFFEGGGVSFEGGFITETPIEFLSLSQIIDRFGGRISATQAANLLAAAQDDFGDFDFGTNTGSGIGSITIDPEFNTILPSDTLNVSDPQFEGLTAEEIALRLTGGNISNF